VVLEPTTCPLIGCSFNLLSRGYSLALQIQAFGDDQQILGKFPQRLSWRPLFGAVAEIGQTRFSERAGKLMAEGI
jgi:hypothetical protein